MPGKDPRIRQDVIDRALRLCEQVERERKGRIVFLSGFPGSGKSATLRAVADEIRLRRSSAKVVAGCFVNGIYQPLNDTERSSAPWKRALEFLGATLRMTSVASNPVVGTSLPFLGHLLAVGVAADNLFVESLTGSTEKDHVEPIKAQLRAAATSQLVVCMLDDIGKSHGPWWTNFILTFAKEITSELAILLLVTLEGPTDLGPHEEGESDSFYLARTLVSKESAAWWSLPPLSKLEVAQWSGWAEPAVIDCLCETTGGNPGWLLSLWNDWQRRGVVSPGGKEGRWCLTQRYRKHSLASIYDFISEHIQWAEPAGTSSLDQVLSVLKFGALEGREFTVEAIAHAIGEPSAKLLGLIEGSLLRTDDNPGLLVKRAPVAVTTNPNAANQLNVYAFASELYWFSVLRYGIDEQNLGQMSLRLAQSLVEVYGPAVRQVADKVAKLFSQSGHKIAATHFQRMADSFESAAASLVHAELLASAKKDNWTFHDYRRSVRNILNGLRDNLWATDLERLLILSSTACDMAEHTGVKADIAEGMQYRGVILTQLGRMDEADLCCRRALPLAQEAGARSLEATLWNDLGVGDLGRGRYSDARHKLMLSVTLYHEAKNYSREAVALRNLSLVDLQLGYKTLARDRLLKAIEVSRMGGDGKEGVLWLSLASHDLAEGRLESAKQTLSKALALSRETNNRCIEGEAVACLSMVDLLEGNCTAARQKAEFAIDIAWERKSIESEAGVFFELGRACVRRGHLGLGAKLLILAMVLLRPLKSVDASRIVHTVERFLRDTGVEKSTSDKMIAWAMNEYSSGSAKELLAEVFQEVEAHGCGQ